MIGAQAELEKQLAELRTSGADPAIVTDIAAQLGALAALQDSIATAKPGALVAMKAEVGGAVAASTAIVQQARVAAAGGTQDSPQLAAASTATRREVGALQTDLFERRIFDPFLHFSSAEDQEEYRRREAENRRYIEQQLARNTSEGNLNAAGATMGQMLDAHAHGAGESPEFLPRWNRLVETTRQHREAMVREGRSTEEFDRNLVTSVRRYLRDKGLSEAEIDAKLAVSGGDPLKAVQPYLKTDKDAQALEKPLNTLDWVKALSANEPVTYAVVPQPAAGENSKDMAAPTVEDAMAQFRAAGVAVSTQETGEAPSHGVVKKTVQATQPDGRTSPA